MTPSTPEMWNNVLTLMAAIVVSDERVRDDELQSFVHNTRLMADEIDRSLTFAEEDLISWFQTQRAEIYQKTKESNISQFIIDNIMALDPFFHKQTLLNCLVNIAAADAEMHPKEVNIINIAAAYWDLAPIRSRVAG